MDGGAGSKNRGYRIPNEELVTRAVRSILEEAVTVRSQTLFKKLVMLKLKEIEGDGFRLSESRLRRITANLEDVDLIIHCREGKRSFKGSKCPVCGSKMKDIKNATLYGWTVATGKACTACSYWVGNRKRIPVRYVFTTEKENYLKEAK